MYLHIFVGGSVRSYEMSTPADRANGSQISGGVLGEVRGGYLWNQPSASLAGYHICVSDASGLFWGQMMLTSNYTVTARSGILWELAIINGYPSVCQGGTTWIALQG